MSINIQQFVDDYMIVIENDEHAWRRHVDIAKRHETVHGIADILRDELEESVSICLDKVDPTHSKYIVNIMREMLLGWGATPYEHIARELLSRIEEGK